VLVEDDVMVGGAAALGEEVGGAAVDDGDGHTGRRGGVLADDGGVLVEVGGDRRGLAENNGALVEDSVVVGGAAELGEGSGGARGKILATRRFRFVHAGTSKIFRLWLVYIKERNTGGPHYPPTSSDPHRWRAS
jgi:hypothetical protein